MRLIADFSIWGDVRNHGWKWEPRPSQINGIIWHSTRGGQGYGAEVEQSATINWFKSPNNSFDNSRYGSVSNYLVGVNIVEVVPENYMPRYSSWPCDTHMISVEVTQSNKGQEYEDRVIDNCVRLARYLSGKYDIEPIRVNKSLSDYSVWGHIGHEDTIQGMHQGKSDPGPEFWEKFWPKFMGDDMSEISELREEVAKLREEVRVLNQAIVERFDIIEVASGPIGLVKAAKKVLKDNGYLKEGDS